MRSIAADRTRRDDDGPGGVHRGRRARRRRATVSRRSTGRSPTASAPPAARPPARPAWPGPAPRSVVRSGISLIATAATAATIAPTTPSQNVWAVARLKAPWMPSTIAPMNGSTAPGTAAGMRGQDRWPRSPTPVSWLEVERPAALACGEAVDDLRRDAGRRHLRHEVAPGTTSRRSCPTKASAIVPPIWRKNVRFEVATPSCAERHGVLDDDREDRERRADAEAGDEHPEPDDRHRRVLGELGHQQDRRSP